MVMCCAAAATAHARRHPQFEPTDLELEDPGTAEFDFQFGVVSGADKQHRLVVPDFELDLGLLDNLELDVDGTYNLAGQPDDHPLFLDHSQPDNLWVSVKIGLYDNHDDDRKSGWAAGLQLGPKIPTGNDMHGIGVEGLFLVGHVDGPVHLVLGVGGLCDPHDTDTPRPYGFESGLDLEYDLVDTKWALLGEVAVSVFGSPDPTQLNATLGLQYSPSDMLDLSIVGEKGFVDGSDPYGIFFGVSPKVAFW